MLWHAFWIIISLFAVIGILECILGAVELIALNRIRSVRDATLRVKLIGDEPHMEYLLNTLGLLVQRLDIGPRETGLEIVDCGLSAASREELEGYCKKNNWVRFTEDRDHDIMTSAT